MQPSSMVQSQSAISIKSRKSSPTDLRAWQAALVTLIVIVLASKRATTNPAELSAESLSLWLMKATVIVAVLGGIRRKGRELIRLAPIQMVHKDSNPEKNPGSR